MKKMRKIFAVLLTLAMVLGMSMTSFAAEKSATITVTGLDKDATVTNQIPRLQQVGNSPMLTMQRHLPVKKMR